MNLTKLALNNSQFVLIVLLIAILLGVRSFSSMPRSEDPQVSFPTFIVTVVYPGTSPEDMENLIVDPIEKVVNEIEDVVEINSSIREGLVVMAIEGSFEKDSKQQYDEVLREVNTVRPELPAGIVFFNVEQIKPEDRVGFTVYALSSENVSYQNLEKLAEAFEDELESIDGVNMIRIEACPEHEIRVSLDFQRMAAQNINLGQVAGILRSNNANVPGGFVRAGAKSFAIQTTGAFENLEEIRNTVISATDNKVILLRDIAQVAIEEEDLRWKAEFNKEKSILMSLTIKTGKNILEVNEQVEIVQAKFEKELPTSVSLNIAFEQASAVEGRINDFFKNLLQGIALVGIVILFFLGVRPAIIIITLIPLSIIMALALLNGAGHGLHQISIASLVLALGLLVDNGIVVIENIIRFIKEGYSKKEAALKGASEVGSAIVSSTVTTLLSFFPLSQLGEGAGLFLAALPLTVIFTLIISLILALTFSPILSSWVLSSKTAKKTIADKAFDWLSDKIYEPILKFSLRRGWLVLLVSVVVSGFAISLFPKIGVSFFPTADKPVLLVDVNLPLGSSFSETEKAVNFVEQVLDEMDYVKNYTSNVGHGGPQIYYNRIPRSFVQEHGQVIVNFKEWDPGKFYEALRNLRLAFKDYGGAKITTSELKNGVPVAAPIEVRIMGEELGTIKEMAEKVEQIFNNNSEVININNPLKRDQTQLRIKLNKAKAGMLGVSELDFDQTVRASLNGLAIDKTILEDDKEYNIVLRMPFDEQPNIEDLDKIYVTNRMGRNMPLKHIAEVEFKGGIPRFSHLNLKRNVAVTGAVNDSDRTLPVTLELIEELKKIDWPTGYSYDVGGEYKEQQSTFGSLGVILMLAQIAIFAVLVLQFKSILQPLIVFSAIPFAISGSFIALYLTGWSFSFFAFVGLISLIGIVVNNSIILVDYINQLMSEGIPLVEAIITGSKRRLKPIILTTITTILGLVPLTLTGTTLWSPLSWTIIGGMISSTLLSLMMVPVFYKWLTFRR